MSSEANIIGYCRVCGKALDETNATAAEGTLYCTEHGPQAQIAAPPPLPSEPPSPYTAPAYHAAPPAIAESGCAGVAGAGFYSGIHSGRGRGL